VRWIDITIPGLPVALDGFTIAQISDLHVGPGNWTPMRVEEATEAIRAETPAVVVNTGDYLQGDAPLEKVMAVVDGFLIEPQEGTSGPVNLAILGNHDYFEGDELAGLLAARLRQQGVTVLANEMARVNRHGESVTIAGLSQQEPGLEDAVQKLRRAEPPRIALVHDADVAEFLPEGTAELVLAGHTHGGQITLPLLQPFIVKYFNGSKYIHGAYRINGNRVYVNRGLGCTGLPVRFRAPPELTFFRLSQYTALTHL
jgi:predicted MPP superfamily phosphohydrolase